MPSHWILLASAVSASWVLSVTEVGYAEGPTLAEIQEHLKRWEAGIAQFKVVWETTYDPHSKLAIDSGVEGLERIGRQEWIVSIDGEEYWHTVGFLDGKVNSRDLRTLDRQKVGYTAVFGPGESTLDNPSTLTIYPKGGLGDPLIRFPFLGLWSHRQGRWLPSILRQQPARLEGFVSCNGRKLPLLVVDVQQHNRFELGLDPQAGYLPRTAVLQYVNDDGQPEGNSFRNEVDEFREISPGWFFPWRGRDTDPDAPATWQVTELVLNESFPASQFIVRPGPATVVTDRVRGTQRVPQPRTTGDSATPLPTAATAVAIPNRPDWAWLIGAVGLVSLAAAMMFRRHETKRQLDAHD